ncbi:MAG: hypothetical protein ABFD44_00400 [Anaerolineaceae bacterium]
MGRVVNPDSVGKERTRLTKGVVLALRELMKQTQPDDTSRDLAAFIALALLEVAEGIEVSVSAWEKRDYWVKADRFRMEWAWTERLGAAMRDAVLADDWGTVAMTGVQVGQKLMKVEVPAHHRLGTPWVGAWKELQKRSK